MEPVERICITFNGIYGYNGNLRKAVKMASKTLRKVRNAAVLSFLWVLVHKVETRTREGDQAGFYKHVKTMNLEAKRDRSSAYVIDENGVRTPGGR